MFDPQTVAAGFGLGVELTDLGAWDGAPLIAEYDPGERAIRVNVRVLEAYRGTCEELNSRDVRAFIDFAVAHELYHHREAIGAVGRLAGRAQREAAADAYARAAVAVDARLDAFISALGVR